MHPECRFGCSHPIDTELSRVGQITASLASSLLTEFPGTSVIEFPM